MENSTSKIAVIGVGNIGKLVAANLTKGNHRVIVADRTYAKAKELSDHLGPNARAAEIAEAIREADIVVMAVYFNAIKELFSTYASDLKNKIIVDPSNPIAPDEKGGFKKIIGANESSGQILSSILPPNAKLAKALGTLGAASLESAAYANPKTVLFYATDDSSINSVIEKLIQDSGFEALRVGGIDQSIRIEVFGDLHEFGGLGKTVTLEEAAKLVSPQN